MKRTKFSSKLVAKNITLKVIEYCLKTERVTLNSMQKDMNLNSEEAELVRNYFVSWTIATGPNHILSKASKEALVSPDIQLHLLPSAIFSYVDHLEIVEARKEWKDS